MPGSYLSQIYELRKQLLAYKTELDNVQDLNAERDRLETDLPQLPKTYAARALQQLKILEVNNRIG